MPTTITLTDSEVGTLIHALRVATERFEEHVLYLRGPARGDGSERLAQQFARQVNESRELADRLEQ